MNMNMKQASPSTLFTMIWVSCLLISTTTALKLRVVTFNTGGSFLTTGLYEQQLRREFPEIFRGQDVVILNFQETYEQKTGGILSHQMFRLSGQKNQEKLQKQLIAKILGFGVDTIWDEFIYSYHFKYAFLTLIVVNKEFMDETGLELDPTTMSEDFGHVLFNGKVSHKGHFGGLFGSKGGVFINLKLGNTNIININSHFNSGNSEHRESEWGAVYERLVTTRNMLIFGSDKRSELAEAQAFLGYQSNIIWLWSGDFNSRFQKKYLQDVSAAVKKDHNNGPDKETRNYNDDVLAPELYGEFMDLLMAHRGDVEEFTKRIIDNEEYYADVVSSEKEYFDGLTLLEGGSDSLNHIDFHPTYKFHFAKDSLIDQSFNAFEVLEGEKKVAWTDRVFYGSNIAGLAATNYVSWPKFVNSDHKPVSLDIVVANSDLTQVATFTPDTTNPEQAAIIQLMHNQRRHQQVLEIEKRYEQSGKTLQLNDTDKKDVDTLVEMKRRKSRIPKRLSEITEIREAVENCFSDRSSFDEYDQLFDADINIPTRKRRNMSEVWLSSNPMEHEQLINENKKIDLPDTIEELIGTINQESVVLKPQESPDWLDDDDFVLDIMGPSLEVLNQKQFGSMLHSGKQMGMINQSKEQPSTIMGVMTDPSSFDDRKHVRKMRTII